MSQAEAKVFSFDNETIINKYLGHYSKSPDSVKTRKHSLNYFFNENYFHYSGHVFEIDTTILIDYFQYLNLLDTLSLESKKTKWKILKSFLEFTMEYYYKEGFTVIIPTYTVKFSKSQPTSRVDRNAIMSEEEVEKILIYFKLRHFKYYLIFRLLADTGMRKGGLLKADIGDINIKKRWIKTKEKSGNCVYYFTKELAELMDIYLKERIRNNANTNALFISRRGSRFSPRFFNLKLKEALIDLKISKNITCHTFRKTINTLRKLKLDCSPENRKILLNHKLRDVNYESYTKLEYKNFIELYDQYYPYYNLTI